MDFKDYETIAPTDKVKFDILFHSAQRSLQRLEKKLHQVYGDKIPMSVFGELLKIGHKLSQMTALWKEKG